MVFDVATVQLSCLVNDVRGAVGPVQFQKRYGRTIIRANTPPANPNTSAQQFQRGLYGRCKSLWDSAVSRFRPAWGRYASPLEISDWNAFVLYNADAEYAPNVLYLSPDNPDTWLFYSLVASSGPNPGQVSLVGVCDGYAFPDRAYAYYRYGGDIAWTFYNFTSVATLRSGWTLSGLTPGVEVFVYVSIIHIAVGLWSNCKVAAATVKT